MYCFGCVAVCYRRVKSERLTPLFGPSFRYSGCSREVCVFCTADAGFYIFSSLNFKYWSLISSNDLLQLSATLAIAYVSMSPKTSRWITNSSPRAIYLYLMNWITCTTSLICSIGWAFKTWEGYSLSMTWISSRIALSYTWEEEAFAFWLSRFASKVIAELAPVLS